MPVDVEIIIEGVRITPWFYRPDGGVLERLEWMTDVIPSFNAKEQRIRLRGVPRRSFEFGVLVSDRERRTAENLLHNWQGRSFGVPVWMDSQVLPVSLTAGATTIAIDTTTRDYYVDGLLGIASDPLTFEVLQIDAVTDSLITLAGPLQNDWTAREAEIFPIRAARLPDSVRFQRFTGATSYALMQFDCVDNSDWPAASEGTTYRGFPILTTAPNWTEDIGQEFIRKIATVDTGTGPRYYDDESGGAVMAQTHRWLLDGRAQIDAFRRWLYARQGRLTAFWLPTFAQDFRPAADIGAASLTIDVEHCGYTDTIAQDVGRRDIRIELHSGSVYYRRITGSTEVSGTVERLTINASLGTLTDADDIRSISYMNLVRLDTDAVEIAWSRWDVAESALLTRGSRNDL